MDLKLYALLKNKISSVLSNCSVVTSDESVINTTLANNTEYRLISPVTSLVINGFSKGDDSFAEVWSLSFTAGDNISVSLPKTVEWAVAEPQFTAGYTYYLSFIPFMDRILGVWVAKELVA